MAVRSTQGQNKAVRSTQRGCHPQLVYDIILKVLGLILLLIYYIFYSSENRKL